VETFDRGPAEKVFSDFMRNKDKPAINADIQKAPLGQWVKSSIVFLTRNFAPSFRVFSSAVERTVMGGVNVLLIPHWSIIIAIFGALAYFYHRSLKLALAIACGLLLIVNLGLWVETIKTLVLVMAASFASLLFGVPLGIMAAKRPWFYSVIRPILDLMQTVPTFVYLIPALMLFGLGLVPGLISTIIFAIAAPIRLTYLGLSQVPKDLIEASEAFGATKFQTLCKIEFPCALPSLMSGVTQCIMLSLSMVVIAALVGAEGLGTPVIRALNTVNIELGFESGIAIVILAIVLDRGLSMRKKRKQALSPN
jgi:glycine betaine/proline transport system permease protein